MKRLEVNSSMIKSIGYEHQYLIMQVEFTNGTIFNYLGVSPSVFDELKYSDSIGKSFNSFIRGKYQAEKIK